VRHKRFDEAINQLAEEGLLQVFLPQMGPLNPIVGVIGPLQLDVIEARLLNEYNVECKIERLPHIGVRWPQTNDFNYLTLPLSGVLKAVDRHGQKVLIFQTSWELQYTIDKNPDINFQESM